MATIRLSDVIYGPLFLPTTIQRIAQLSRIRNSPIVSADAQIQQFANGPGDIVQMPFWNDLAGDSNVSTDDPAQSAVPNKLSQGQDSAGNFGPNVDVMTAGGVGVQNSNTNVETGAPAQTAEEAGTSGLPESLRIAKGARGKWYVRRGSEKAAGPFDTEDEAKTAMAAPAQMAEV